MPITLECAGFVNVQYVLEGLGAEFHATAHLPSESNKR